MVQVIFGDVLIAARVAWHQCRRCGLWAQRARGQFVAETLGQRLQLLQRLRAGKVQCHLPALIELAVKFPQCLLKCLTFHRQAIPVTGMKTAQRMVGRQALQQRKGC